MGGESLLLETLGTKTSLLFGEECLCSAIWMIFILSNRLILKLLHIDNYVPYGLIFAFPLVIQLLSGKFELFRKYYPMLPVRLTESVMGRIKPLQLLVVIPAHVFGNIIGIVFYSLITLYIPYLPVSVFDPIAFKRNNFVLSELIIDILIVFLYNIVIIVVPELLSVNKLSPTILSFIAFPLSFCSNTTFHPAAVYALWYIGSGHEWLWVRGTDANYNALSYSQSLQFEYVICPVIAAILAGIFCNKYFPDDNKSWKRREDL